MIITPLVDSNNQVNNVEDDAQTSANYQQYTNDGRLMTTVCADLGVGRGLIRLTDVNWLYDSTMASHHRLLLLWLHPDDHFLHRHEQT